MIMPAGESALAFLLVLAISSMTAAEYELELVHVIFRHGDRSTVGIPDGVTYPTDPYLNYTYYPEGIGNLNNEGKLTMYNLGLYLRQRYDEFLGDVYTPDIVKVRTTEVGRTMMSAQLVNAGLWPPSTIQQWHPNLNWMPIPTNYVAEDTDSLMLSYECPTYENEYQEVLRSEEVKRMIEPYMELFLYLTEQTGRNVTMVQDVLFLYNILLTQKSYNLTLPSWTEGYFPDGDMYDLALLEYEISSWSTLLKKLFGGPLVHKVLADSFARINGTLSTERKLMMYSGHDSNICSVLQTLGLWYPHVPDYSSAVIFELYHENVSDEYGIQVVYYTGKSNITIPLTLPGCTQICEISQFKALLEDVIPEDIDEICEINISVEDDADAADESWKRGLLHRKFQDHNPSNPTRLHPDLRNQPRQNFAGGRNFRRH